MSEKKLKFSGAIQTGERPTPGATATSENSTRRNRVEPAPVPFSADELRRISSEISAKGLPAVEATRLELMEIDPWNVHAYWHIDAADMAAGRARLPENARDARLVLRFSDVSPRQNGTGAYEPFDIEVREDSNNWYVNLWRDAKRYSADIGLRAADGDFVPLARSNEVATPRGGPSPGLDFLQVEVRTPRAPEAAPAGGSTTPVDTLLRELFPQRRPPVEEFPLVMPEASDRPLEAPAFPRLEVPSEGAATAALRAGEALEPATVEAPSRAEVDQGSSGAMAFPVLAPTEISRYHHLARMTKTEFLAQASLPPLPPVAVETIAPADFELVSHPLPILPVVAAGDTASNGRVAEAARPSAGPEHPPAPLALEAILGKTVFSPSAMDAAVAVSASIVIEGQGSPDAPLSLFGEPVLLQPDGRLTVRLPLEGGPDLVALLHHVWERHRKE